MLNAQCDGARCRLHDGIERWRAAPWKAGAGAGASAAPRGDSAHRDRDRARDMKPIYGQAHIYITAPLINIVSPHAENRGPLCHRHVSAHTSINMAEHRAAHGRE